MTVLEQCMIPARKSLSTQGWDMETPGMRNEFHAPKDYGGKRIIVKREVPE